MKQFFIFLIFLIQSIFLQSNLFAAQISFDNGDKITGEIISSSENSIELETKALGVVTVERKFIKQVIDTNQTQAVSEDDKETKLWNKELSLGYDKSNGNTQSNQASIKLYTNRKSDSDELTISGQGMYASSNKKMDAQRYSGLIRYAFSFGQRKWYNFYKLQGDHDRFTNINYRITPSIGLGYWFHDESDKKLMIESAIGLEHVDFRDNTKKDNRAVLIPRLFFEKNIFLKSKIRQDTFLYSNIENLSKFRVCSETTFINPVSDKLSLHLSFIDEYNSNPPSNTKKNDTRLVSSLVYTF